jgi:hypothetical protein
MRYLQPLRITHFHPQREFMIPVLAFVLAVVLFALAAPALISR